MDLKERVNKMLEDEETKQLWEEIYLAFEDGGINGIEKLLIRKVEEIKNEFEEIKSEIDKKIKGK
ncbi:hypothetical protein [Candidatus Chrysopegis kryptomonas]|jgi:hypothetical protein|uniref:Uncharacterized protein n=1 Tax=Candidatus Chryseopegocella kryptomonas TaxID=1633643 RepID=A0A0P1MM03_9BACT|nr:hypothetical protein [Candidatus Chrysopegis kryptomonas]CUS96688.1 hypothetical protein JGI23_00163 [Candidatus Chrysopegis kryptomonas]